MADYKSQLFTPKKKQVWTGVTYSKKSVYYKAKLEGFQFFGWACDCEGDLHVINSFEANQFFNINEEESVRPVFLGFQEEKVKAMSTTWRSCT